MELQVFNKEGKSTGRTITLPAEVFGIEPNEHAVYLDVKQYLANQRQGTHKSKERAEVARTTKKLKKQKGTGGARAGSMKSPVFVGGGRVFGPRPRSYSFKVNRKTKDLARKSVLTSKALANNIMVVEDFTMAKPATREFVSTLNNLSLAQSKSLFVFEGVNTNVVLSSRNLPNAKVVSADSLNTYQLLNNEKLVISEKAVESIKNQLTR